MNQRDIRNEEPSSKQSPHEDSPCQVDWSQLPNVIIVLLAEDYLVTKTAISLALSSHYFFTVLQRSYRIHAQITYHLFADNLNERIQLTDISTKRLLLNQVLSTSIGYWSTRQEDCTNMKDYESKIFKTSKFQSAIESKARATGSLLDSKAVNVASQSRRIGIRTNILLMNDSSIALSNIVKDFRITDAHFLPDSIRCFILQSDLLDLPLTSMSHLSKLHTFDIRPKAIQWTLSGWFMPRNLQQLTVQVDESLSEVSWPQSSLTYLYLDSCFNQPIQDANLPDSLTTLVFGHRFNQPIAKLRLPNSLTQLLFGDSFNHPIREFKLPSSLQRFELGFMFNQSLEQMRFPSTLKVFHLGNFSFNQSLKGLNLHEGLVVLALLFDSSSSCFAQFETLLSDLPKSLLRLIIPDPNNHLQYSILIQRLRIQRPHLEITYSRIHDRF